MKQFNFRHLIALILMMCSMMGKAQIFEVGKYMYYSTDSNQRCVEVVAPLGDIEDLEVIDIPSSITKDGVEYTVNKVGEKAFYECKNLTSVTIPGSVKSIGEWAFSRCSILTSITIPSSVTSIGEKAFSWCESLTSVTIPNSVTSIGGESFFACSSLTSITIPSSVTSIGNWAFRGCSSLTSINIPSSVTSIGYGAFMDCSSLTSITIPSSVKSIGKWAFENCEKLRIIVLPEHITNIDELSIPSQVRIIRNAKADHSLGNNASDEKGEKEEVVDNAIVEVQATYPGGEAAIFQHIAKNLQYPALALEQELQGVVVVRFEVKKDGSIGRTQVAKSFSKECDREAVRVVKTLQRFTPARHQGKPVAVWYTLPIRFQIQ